MTAHAVPGFLPSTNGFGFRNDWPSGPTLKIGPFDPRVIGVGDAKTGLCGGMVMTVRDLFEAGLTAAGRPQPENGSPPFDAIVRRQVQSLDCVPRPAPVLRPDGASPGPAGGPVRAAPPGAAARGGRGQGVAGDPRDARRAGTPAPSA